jgi:hypothetical protein
MNPSTPLVDVLIIVFKSGKLNPVLVGEPTCSRQFTASIFFQPWGLEVLDGTVTLEEYFEGCVGISYDSHGLLSISGVVSPILNVVRLGHERIYVLLSLTPNIEVTPLSSIPAGSLKVLPSRRGLAHRIRF